jgi:hypothetical protein
VTDTEALEGILDPNDPVGASYSRTKRLAWLPVFAIMLSVLWLAAAGG